MLQSEVACWLRRSEQTSAPPPRADGFWTQSKLFDARLRTALAVCHGSLAAEMRQGGGILEYFTLLEPKVRLEPLATCS